MISRLKQSNTAGFTLIEALVAITILLLAIAGPMTIASQGLKLSADAREQMTAFYIAQEGVELVRAIRDTNALETNAGTVTDWLDGISATCISDACGIDVETYTARGGSPNAADFQSCTAASMDPNCVLFYDASGHSGGAQRGVFTHRDTGNASPYTRMIRIRSVNFNTEERYVSVTVEWRSRGVKKSVQVYSRLFNQYDYLTPAP